ncbi:hypothetical protein [Actinoallomurus sp. NPDC050550]|uniref:hypothetical protein n=1 Tax=Actinoallomurus sp. NPDC050550 TaxID=3154937 RepID=UPI0033D40031
MRKVLLAGRFGGFTGRVSEHLAGGAAASGEGYGHAAAPRGTTGGSMSHQDTDRARRIQAALDDFRATLASVPVVGVAHWSEIDQLTELIRRNPQTARRILDDLEDGP